MLFHRHISILAIIIVTASVFAFEQSRASSFAQSYGAVPSMIGNAVGQLVSGKLDLGVVQTLLQLFTAMFLHADAEHILYNMVFLWTFGYLTSQNLGQWWALLVFLVCGVCGNVVQVCLNLDSTIPIVGASGAICGFGGTYVGLALRWRLPWPDVWPLAHPIPPFQLGALAVLGFLGDIYMLSNHDQQIAYGAHIGGFLSGLAISAFATTMYPTAAAYDRAGQKR